MPDTTPPESSPPPRPVACRTALALCAHVLHGRALVLRNRTGRKGRHVAASQAEGRERDITGLEAAAERLLLLSRTPDAAKWPSSDAALVGHLAAYLMGDPHQWTDLLAEMEEAGRSMPTGIDRNDTADVTVAALGVPPR